MAQLPSFALDFERPLLDLERKIEELKSLSGSGATDFGQEISRLEKKARRLQSEISSDLSRWQVTQLSRHPARPYFLDYVEAGSVQDDWLILLGGLFAQLYVNHSELAGQKPPKPPVAAQPDSFYTGTYGNAYYGPIRIAARGKSLHLLIGPGPDDYPLQHWSGNVFAFYPTGENAVGITAATFHPGSRSRAESVTLEYYNENGLGTFTRP